MNKFENAINGSINDSNEEVIMETYATHSLKGSAILARLEDRRYSGWLVRTWEKTAIELVKAENEAREELKGLGFKGSIEDALRTPGVADLASVQAIVELHGSMGFFENELKLLNSWYDWEDEEPFENQGTTRWFTRDGVDELEFGNPADFTRIEAETPEAWELSMSREEPDYQRIANDSFFSRERTMRFSDKAKANAFYRSVKDAERRGDKRLHVIDTRVEEGTPEPFVVVLNEWDRNWGHWTQLREARGQRVEMALQLVDEAQTRGDLWRLKRHASKLSRENQLIQKGQSRVSKKGPAALLKKALVTSMGLSYEAYATISNAIADRAEELGVNDNRLLKQMRIETYSSPHVEADGDILDLGGRQGLEVVEATLPDLGYDPEAEGFLSGGIHRGYWRWLERHLDVLPGTQPLSWAEQVQDMESWLLKSQVA